MSGRKISYITRIIAMLIIFSFVFSTYGGLTANALGYLQIEKIVIEARSNIYIKDTILKPKTYAIYKNGKKELIKNVTYKSQNSKIVTVSKDGVLKAVNEGTTLISTSYKDKDATLSITVKSFESLMKSMDIPMEMKIRQNWERDSKRVRLWWSRNSYIGSTSILRKSEGSSDFQTVAEGIKRQEYIDKNIDPSKTYTYKIVLIDKIGARYELKPIVLTPAERKKDKSASSQSLNKNNESNTSIKKQIETKTEYSGIEAVKDSKKIHKLNKSSDSCTVDIPFYVTKKLLYGKSDEIEVKYTSEDNQRYDETKLVLYRMLEDGQEKLFDDQLKIDTINKTIKVKIKDEGVYVLKEDKEKENSKTKAVETKGNNGDISQASNPVDSENLEKQNSVTDSIYKGNDGTVTDSVYNEDHKSVSQSVYSIGDIEKETCIKKILPDNVLEFIVKQPYRIDKEFIEKQNGAIIFKYIIEDKNINENKLYVHRLDENGNTRIVNGKVILDTQNRELWANIYEPGIYVIEERNTPNISGNSDVSSKFNIALSGLFGYSQEEITNEVIESYKSKIPEGSGIWVTEKDRDYILSLINKSANKVYFINEYGFLAASQEVRTDGAISNTFSSIIDSLINSGRKVTISRQRDWLYLNNETNKLERAKFSNSNGITIGNSNGDQLVILSDEPKDEAGQIIPSLDNLENPMEIIFIHEMIHSIRGISGLKSEKIEEAIAIKMENVVRKELGYQERIVEGIEDIPDSEIGLYSYDVDLDYGATGPAVVEMQQYMIKLGMDLGGYGATGTYGDYSMAAAKAIQEYKGYSIVGRYGPSTRAATVELVAKVDAYGNYPEKSAIVALYKKYASNLTPNTNLDLDMGSSGPSVVVLQEKLLKLGFDLGGKGATGYFGTYTANSLKAVQALKGYELVGRYGPATRAAIEDLLTRVDVYGYYPEKATLMQRYYEVITDIDLDPGASGEAVKELQRKLMVLGFDLGGYGITGYFGSCTVNALKAIQDLKGLDTIGRYGPSTRAVVKELVSKVDSFGYYPEKSALMQRYTKILLNVDLDPGASGPSVKELQNKCLYLGFDLGGFGASGYFGNYTVAVMKAIQEYYGYGIVGRYGPSTRAAVIALVEKVDENGNYPEKEKLLELYKKYVLQFAVVDTPINVNGSFVGNYVYYDQEDPKWNNIMYGDNTMGKSACGPTSMAMVLSTIKNISILPTELCDYAVAKGYRINGQGTSRAFFAAVSNTTKYNLNCVRLPKSDLNKVKTLLSDGKHMAIAIMTPGQFTSGGHYIVLSGVRTINGSNYFEVMDSHRDNNNYMQDGSLIDTVINDGFVTAKTTIFASQADEYWVFSASNPTSTDDPVVKAKINLESLGYGNLRNANGMLDSVWDTNFSTQISRFIDDYGLISLYNSLTQGEKTTIPLIWIQQAVNGQRTKVTSDPAAENRTGGEEVTIGSIALSFLEGIKDAAVGAGKDIWEMLTHPLETIEQTAEGIAFIAKAVVPGTQENDMIKQIIESSVKKIINEFVEGSANDRAKMIGRAVGEIIIGFIGTKGVDKLVKIMKVTAKSGQLAKLLTKVKKLDKADGMLSIIKKVSDALDKIKSYSNKTEAVFEYVEETEDLGDVIRCKTKDMVEVDIPKDELDEPLKKCLNGRCFTGDTLVWTSKGQKRIDSIKVGDMVLSKDSKTGQTSLKKVLDTYQKYDTKLILVNINGQLIKTTSYHLFMVHGWGWKTAETLKPGDNIINTNGNTNKVTSVSVDVKKTAEKVYNLNVDDYHTYFVGEAGLWVHNSCGVKLKKANEFYEAYKGGRIAEFVKNLAINQVSKDHAFVKKTKEIFNEIKRLAPDLSPGNTAYSKIDIPNLNTKELKAFSGRKSLSGFVDCNSKDADSFISHYVGKKEKKLDMPVDPKEYKKELDAKEIWNREIDTEYKILSEIDKQLRAMGNADLKSITGAVELHTRLDPCASCLDVMRQFCERYPNISLKVTYELVSI